MTPTQLAHHQTRRALLQEFGKRIDSHKEASNDELSRMLGAQVALAQAAEKIDAQKEYWRSLHKDGKLKDGSLMQTESVIDQCAGAARSLAQGAQLQALVCRGKVACANDLLDVCETLFKAEDAIILAPQEPVSPVITLRKAGEHPGEGLAAQRKVAASPKKRRAP